MENVFLIILVVWICILVYGVVFRVFRMIEIVWFVVGKKLFFDKFGLILKVFVLNKIDMVFNFLRSFFFGILLFLVIFGLLLIMIMRRFRSC